MTGPETRIQRRIRKAIKKTYPGSKFFKIHGNEYQEVGIPDLLGCVKSIFVGMEVKVPGEEPDPIQKVRLAQIRRAGGIAGTAHSVKEALELIRIGLLKRAVNTIHLEVS